MLMLDRRQDREPRPMTQFQPNPAPNAIASHSGLASGAVGLQPDATRYANASHSGLASVFVGVLCWCPSSLPLSSPPHPPPSGTQSQPARPVGGCKELSVPSGTNLDDVCLASVDRNNKATLPRTAPSRAIKSSAKDLSLRIVKLPYDGEGLGLFRPRPRCRPSAIQGQRPIRIRL
ncbi:uncharacterized protein LAJ45_11535 [Morchella importuna]|uniref:uncharacterized protein n=1 Tax=Morchella importuna TaxID=1174673 RepID=UPI001E8DB7D9|nr:uncharacterized protein LAJ45_11535 [Morchella importuna]KAH8144470.1 hypothetical protein LAJ45_11535 [Morchella importuna]